MQLVAHQRTSSPGAFGSFRFVATGLRLGVEVSLVHILLVRDCSDDMPMCVTRELLHSHAAQSVQYVRLQLPSTWQRR